MSSSPLFLRGSGQLSCNSRKPDKLIQICIRGLRSEYQGPLIAGGVRRSFDDLIYRASALEDFYCDQGAYVHVAELGGRGRGRGNGQSGRPRKQGHRKDLRYPIDKTESLLLYKII